MWKEGGGWEGSRRRSLAAVGIHEWSCLWASGYCVLGVLGVLGILRQDQGVHCARLEGRNALGEGAVTPARPDAWRAGPPLLAAPGGSGRGGGGGERQDLRWSGQCAAAVGFRDAPFSLALRVAAASWPLIGLLLPNFATEGARGHGPFSPVELNWHNRRQPTGLGVGLGGPRPKCAESEPD